MFGQDIGCLHVGISHDLFSILYLIILNETNVIRDAILVPKPRVRLLCRVSLPIAQLIYMRPKRDKSHPFWARLQTRK